MNTSFNSTLPSLVLAIGPQAERITLEAQALFAGNFAANGNPWRMGTACFISLRCAHTAGALQVGCGPLKTARISKSSPCTRQEIYAAALHSAADLRSALETALHDLRAHEQTMLVGLAEKRAFSLQVLVLADLTQPESAAVFPLLALLDDLLTHEPDKQVLLLLQAAQFSGDKDEIKSRNACCQAGLRDLQALCAAHKNGFQERLAQDLSLPASASQPVCSVFLFDRYKEGGWEVKDESELRILSANFLLALLTSGLGARVEPRAWHSAGSTALVYDPQVLIETCATRAALEFIRREFNTTALPDLHTQQQAAAELHALYGDLHDWLQAMLAGTAFTPRAGEIPGLETHFADLSFDELPLEEWSLAIQGYDTHFGQRRCPADLEKLKTNTQTLAERLRQEQANLLETLPRQARLYPGGLAGARKIIAELCALLRLRREYFPDLAAGTSEPDEPEAASTKAGVELALQKLDEAVGALPQPPHWVRLLPFSLKSFAKHLFALLYLRSEQARLVLLRQQAVLALEAKYTTILESAARAALGEVCQQLDSDLDEFDQALEAFQEEAQKACARLEHLGEKSAGTSLFRQTAVDDAALAWASQEFKKPDEEMRYLLFEERDFLFYWRDMDGHNLETGLLAFMREQYQPLWSYNLDQILGHRADGDLTPLWTQLSQGSLPLLRPDFDSCPAHPDQAEGGDGQSYQTRHFLCGSPRNTVFAPFLNQPLSEWEPLATGDPTLTMCVRLRHLIPLAALRRLLERGQQDFEHDSPEERSALCLFPIDQERPA